MEKLTPVEIVKIFDRYVYGQMQAKKMLAIAMRNRYRVNKLNAPDRLSVHKQNLLIVGPTGTGKTALMRVLKTQFGLPVLELDMTAYTESGYVGREVTSIGKDLAELAGSVHLPDWYIEMRTRRKVEKEEQDGRLTRDQWEKESRKQVERERNERDAERQLEIQAKRDHTALLRRQGILDEKDLYEEIQDIYCLRAFMVGYCHEHSMGYDDFDIYEVILGGRTVQEWLTVITEMVQTMFGLDSITDFLNTNNVDQRLDEIMGGEGPGALAFMAEIMSLMAIGEHVDMYIDCGQELMSSNLDLSCADGSHFWDGFDTFDGNEEGVEPAGINWIPRDATSFTFDMLRRLETPEKWCEWWDNTFEGSPEFTKYADPRPWSYEIKKEPEPEKETINRQDLKKLPNCNGHDFVENFAVVFLDEFDKLIERGGSSNSHVSRSGVQRGLLKLVEGGNYHGIDTTNILFVAAGSFADAPPSKLMPELQGRFPLRAQMEPLDEGALIAICKLDNSEFHGMMKLLKTDNVETKYDMDTYQYIAERTVEANRVDDLGARRLADIVHEIFQPALYDSSQHPVWDIRGETLRTLDKERIC
ncbi:heat shock protein ATPase subunit HslU domain-containing protein [Salmonella phage SPAsTU]|nr:heat shock protein ATPase subunit HslU domain-containing protein [Salmonella phage SPAsTU]